MADLTSSEIRTEYEGQKEMISKLEDQLREKEGQLNEGERLRKKLHNTILVSFFLIMFRYKTQILF